MNVTARCVARMTNVLMIIVPVTFAACTLKPELHDSERPVPNEFPTGSRFSQTGGKSVFEYCPDNTCDRIVGPERVDERTIIDFSYLYLFYFSDYQALHDWRDSPRSTAYLDAVLIRMNFPKCSKENKKKEFAECASHEIAEREGIRVYQVRFDEGEEILTPVDLPSP